MALNKRLSSLLKLKRKLDRFIESLERDRITREPEKKIEKAFVIYFDKQGNGLVKALSKFKGRFTESVSDKELETAFNKVSIPLQVGLSKVVIEQTGVIMQDAAVKTVSNLGLGNISASVNMQTTSAIQYLEAHAGELISNIDDTTRAITKRIIVDGAKAGKNYSQISEELKNQFDIFKVGKPQQHIRSRAEFIATTEARTAYETASYSSVQSLDSAGLEMIKSWDTVGDNRVSDGCAENEDKGWIPVNEVFPSGHQFPPRFPGCYSDDTEVYTEKGWQLIKDVSIGDIVYSLNPETFNLEKTITKATIKHPANKLINFKSKRFDLLVTGNHQMFYQTDQNRKTNKSYQFIEASSLIGKQSGRFFAGLNWAGLDIKYIEVGSHKIPIDTYCKFMGFYLSDGSISKQSKGNKWNIKISKSKEKNLEVFNIIEDTVKQMPGKWWIGKEAIYTSDEDLCEYVKQFKKSNEKFVPDIIKLLSPDKIKIFLEAYCMCDGHKRKPRMFNGSMCVSEVSYFTSSKRMAGDIGELILKVGKRPTFHTKKTKGLLHKFRNGWYKINHDNITIREVNTLHYNLKSMDIKYIPYNGYVYCIELEKNHIMLIRKNGKVVWCGNCRCDASYKRKSDQKRDEEFLRSLIGLDVKVSTNL